MSDVEVEFRALVTELMDAGVEPTDMMDDPVGKISANERWQQDLKPGRCSSNLPQCSDID